MAFNEIFRLFVQSLSQNHNKSESSMSVQDTIGLPANEKTSPPKRDL